MAENSSILVVLLETHPRLWQALAQNQGKDGGLSPATFLQQVLSYLNACLLINERMELAVLAVHSGASHLLYSSQQTRTDGAAVQRPAGPLAQSLHTTLTKLLEKDEAAGPPALSAALSRALCMINASSPARSQFAEGAPRAAKARVLCVTASADEPSQYMSFMNAVFAAQALRVMVDACVIGAADSAFLQQATDMTKGTYARPGTSPALLQWLLMSFVTASGTRGLLQAPKLHGIDFCASCFCHKRAIDLGFVCSVCLSVFCSEVDDCTTCGTSFKT